MAMAMKNSVKFWQGHSDWREAERAWDVRAEKLALETPLKTFKKNPELPGIRRGTRKNLSWKTLAYLHYHDYSGKLGDYFWQRPIKHGLGLLTALLKRHSYRRDGDFFLYGLRNLAEFATLLDAVDSVLVVGFSYCHKPFECPAGRFTDACFHDADDAVCGQCFIGKCVHSLPETQVVPLFITTVHYIGEKMIEARENWPGRNVIFVITACELTLEMFGKIGVAVDLKGIGVRLDGQICNTMKAFEASEVGIKPGMAIVTDKTQRRMLALFEQFSGVARESELPVLPDADIKNSNIIATDGKRR